MNKADTVIDVKANPGQQGVQYWPDEKAERKRAGENKRNLEKRRDKETKSV